jgi:molecular chaperone DnaK
MSKRPAIGIDLGTTYSAVAVLNHAGRPEIVPNVDGERITASAVYFQQSGPVVIGNDAVNAAGGWPDRVVRWVKREMGNDQWSFEIDGRPHGAVELSALILKKIKQDTEQILGPIDAAVITVPAYFDELRRKATMDAAKLAGLEVLRIINEPTAAALAYASSGTMLGKLLIYDLGGGTFDVSIVEVASPSDVSVIASEGDHRLGGHDFDLRLAEHFDAAFRKEFGESLLDDPVSRHETIQEAERVKRTLSKLESAPASLRKGGRSTGLTVTRDVFEQLTNDLLSRTEMLIENALDGPGLRPADIDGVVLVGGSTRLPAVQRMLQKRFGKPPIRTVNPDEAVALGASIQAAIILADRGESDLPASKAREVAAISLSDVTNHSYGTIALEDSAGVMMERNSIIIPKSTPIPCSITKSYYTVMDSQTQIECQITQGEDLDPEFVNTLAAEVMELPPGRPANQEIAVTFSYDANGRMACDFHDLASGRRKHFDLDVNDASGDRAAPGPSFGDIDFSDLDIL